MEELAKHLGYVKALGIISVGAIVITLLIYLIFRKYSRFIKYIPGLLILSVGIYNLFQIDDNFGSKSGLESMFMFMTGGVGGVISLLTGLIIGIATKESKTKKSKKQ